MGESEGRGRVVTELEAALEAETNQQKDFHVRQALQLLNLDGERRSDADSE